MIKIVLNKKILCPRCGQAFTFADTADVVNIKLRFDARIHGHIQVSCINCSSIVLIEVPAQQVQIHNAVHDHTDGGNDMK